MTMSTKTTTNSDLKVRDYSRFGDVNEYIESLKGDAFAAYRRQWRLASKMEKEFNFPLFLVFETMFKCNLRCSMCIHSALDKTRYAYQDVLPMQKFKEIITEASRYGCPSLTIGGTSEPLLDERVPAMIDFARRAGFVDTMINTNATLLSRELAKRLVSAGLVRLRIGFDGATARTYESIRIGANYEKVKNNILEFMKVRDEMDSVFPVVRISCVHLSANNSELEQFVQFWKNKVEYVSIQRYKPHELTEERSWAKVGEGKRASSKKIKCSQPFERVYIRGNGDVHACCSMVYGPKVGNVFRQSIYDIWNSDKMRKLRAILKKGELDKIPSCKKCMQYSYDLD